MKVDHKLSGKDLSEQLKKSSNLTRSGIRDTSVNQLPDILRSHWGDPNVRKQTDNWLKQLGCRLIDPVLERPNEVLRLALSMIFFCLICHLQLYFFDISE